MMRGPGSVQDGICTMYHLEAEEWAELCGGTSIAFNTWILVLSWSIYIWKTSFMSVEVTVSMKQDLRHWLQFHVCAMRLWGLTVFVASFIYVLPWHGSKPTRCHAVFAFTSLSFAFHSSKQGWKSLPEQILERWWNELFSSRPVEYLVNST